MRRVPILIFLFHIAYAIPGEIEGSERETVLSVLTAAGATGEGGRKLTCTAITGCLTYNPDCSCESCSSGYTYMSTTSKCCKNLSNCITYDPNTCLCTGCSSSLYKVNTKGKCVCVSVTGSVLDKKCAVIGCSSGYTYLSTVKKCCKNVDNCGTYDPAPCACTGCVSTLYSLKNGKCVCKTIIKGCSQYDTNCNCTGCSSTYVFSSGKCVTQSPTPAPTQPTPAPVRSCTAQTPCYCTLTEPCIGVQSPGVYDCGGKECLNGVCRYACGGATFTGGEISCHDWGCFGATFSNNCHVSCNFPYGCQKSIFNSGVMTCHDTSTCGNVAVSGGQVYCNDSGACKYGTFSNSSVSCAVDFGCMDSVFDNNAIVTCLTVHACGVATFKEGSCCVSGGYCPSDVYVCGSPTSAPTPAPTPAPTNPTPAPTPVPTTPAPTPPTVYCPSSQFITGLHIEYGGATHWIYEMMCSGTTDRIPVTGFGAHILATDPTFFPKNTNGYCSYRVGTMDYLPANTATSGLTLIGCDNVSEGQYGSPAKDVITSPTCPSGQKMVAISATTTSWTSISGTNYPALMSQFSMICG